MRASLGSRASADPADVGVLFSAGRVGPEIAMMPIIATAIPITTQVWRCRGTIPAGLLRRSCTLAGVGDEAVCGVGVEGNIRRYSVRENGRRLLPIAR